MVLGPNKEERIMLEYFYCSPTRLRQMRRGPLGEYIDGFAAKLSGEGYSVGAARNILSPVGRFSRFAQWMGTEAHEIDEGLVRRFLEEELGVEGKYKIATSAMAHMLEYLRREGIVPLLSKSTWARQTDRSLLDDYEAYMRDVRGLAEGSRYNCRRGASRFLEWLEKRRPGCELANLSGADVLDFVLEQVRLLDGVRRHGLASQLRSFLRYLQWTGVIEDSLERVVPKVPQHRLKGLPRHLPWEQVRKLIDSIDTNQPEGMRDKATLLLMAGLGLRNQEVCRLQCNDIVWR